MPDADVKHNEGKVIAVGPGTHASNGTKIEIQSSVGDKVMLPEYGGTLIKLDGQDYHLFRDEDILGKLQ